MEVEEAETTTKKSWYNWWKKYRDDILAVVHLLTFFISVIQLVFLYKR